MADEKTILFKIQLDTGDILVKQAVLTKEIEKVRIQMEATRKASGESSVEFQKQKAELGNLQREYRNTNNILQTNQRIANANKGSYEELLNVTKKMEIELKLMGNAGKGGTEEFKKLQSQVKTNREEIIKFGENIKDGRQNVGNYKDALSGMTAGFKGLLGALGVTVSIGALISAIGKSIDAFREAEVNANKLRFAVTQVGNEGEEAFGKLLAQSKELQEVSIFSDDAIQNAQTQLANFGLTSNQIERLVPQILDLASASGVDLATATDKVIQGINGQTKGLKDVGIQYEDTGSKTENLAILQEKLGKFTGATGNALKTSAGQAELLKNQLGEMEEELGAKLTPVLDAFKLSLFDAAAGILGLQTSTDKFIEKRSGVNKFIESYKNLTDAQLEAQRKFAEQDLVKQFQDAQSAINEDAKKASQERQRLANDELQAIIKIQQQRVSASESANDKIADDLTIKGQKALESLTKVSETLRPELQIVNPDDVQDNLNIVTKITTDSASSLINSLQKLRQDSQIVEKGSFIQTQDEISEINKSEFQKRLDQLEEEKAAFLINHLTTQEQREEITKEFAERENQIRAAQVQSNLSLAQDAISQLQQLAEGNTGAQKALALFQVGLDTAKAVSALTANSEANPANAITFGTAGILQFATGILRIFANIAQAKNIISATPKAEHGIILGGQPHSSGGTMISADGVPIAEAERGELLTIVNKKSTGMLQGLSNLNQLGGGIPFMERGGIPEFQSGGIAITNDRFAQQNSIANLLQNLPRPVVAVQHIIEATSKLTDVENSANI